MERINPLTPIIKRYCDILATKDAAFAAKYNPEKIDDMMKELMDVTESVLSDVDGCWLPNEISYKMARDYFLEGKVLESEHYVGMIKNFTEEDMNNQIFGNESAKPKKTSNKKKQEFLTDGAEPGQLDLFGGLV